MSDENADYYDRTAERRAVDLDALRTALTTTLARQLPVTDVTVSNLKLPKGAGTSSGTILFTASWNADGTPHTRNLVARTHPEQIQLYPAPDFRKQYTVIEALHRSGRVRVPEAILYEADDRLIGVPFYVMEQLKGRVPVSIPHYTLEGFLAEAKPAQRRIAWESGLEELCRIARVPVDEVGFLDEPELGESGLDQHLEYWRRGVDWATQNRTPERVWAMYEWLAKHLPDDRPNGFAWGDARIGNMMIGDDFRVVGVMDWEAANLGGIRQDLAWWLFFDEFNGPARDLPVLDGFGTRAETIALWEDRVGEPAGDLTWFEVFVGFQIALLSIRGQLTMGAPDALDLDKNVGFGIARTRLGW